MSRKALIGAVAAALALGAVLAAPAASSASSDGPQTQVLQRVGDFDRGCEVKGGKTVTSLSHSPDAPSVDDAAKTAPVTLTAVTKPDSSSDTTVVDGRWRFVVANISGVVFDEDGLSSSATPSLAPGSYKAFVLFHDSSTVVGGKEHGLRYCDSFAWDEVSVIVVKVVETPGPTVTETTPGPVKTVTVTVTQVDKPASGGSSGPGFTG